MNGDEFAEWFSILSSSEQIAWADRRLRTAAPRELVELALRAIVPESPQLPERYTGGVVRSADSHRKASANKRRYAARKRALSL